MGIIILLASTVVAFDPAATDLSVGGGLWGGAAAACARVELYHVPDDDVHLTLPVCVSSDGMDLHWFRGPSGLAAVVQRLSWEGSDGTLEAGLMWGTKRVLDSPGSDGLYLSHDWTVPRPVLEAGVEAPWIDVAGWMEGLEIREAAGGSVLVGPRKLRFGVVGALLSDDDAALKAGGWYVPLAGLTIGAGYVSSGAHGAFVSLSYTRQWDHGSVHASMEGLAGQEGFVPHLLSPLALVRGPTTSRFGASARLGLRWRSALMRAIVLEHQGFEGAMSVGVASDGTFYAEASVAFDQQTLLVAGSSRWLIHDPWFVGVEGSLGVAGPPVPSTVLVYVGIRDYWFRP